MNRTQSISDPSVRCAEGRVRTVGPMGRGWNWNAQTTHNR